MPILKKLILVSAKETDLPQREKDETGKWVNTGKTIKKWKYVFLKEPGTYANEKEKHLIAWDNDGFWRDDVKEIGAWDSNAAKYYPFDLTTYQGNVVEKLSNGVQPPEK